MWCLLLILCIPWTCSGFTDLNPNYFCRDLNPQPHIDITQLTGLWYGIEMVNHYGGSYEDRIYEEKMEPSCPIIHISQDRESSTTINPLYKNYNYDYNYGERHGYGYENRENRRTQKPYDRFDRYDQTTDHPLTEREMQRRLREKFEYDTRTTYGNYQDAQRQRFGYFSPIPYYETRYLRLIWDQSGGGKEFHVRYNTSQPGFWKSSGPEFGGATLDPQYSHFAGTIQVIKAVGNHLVLTFCHLLPKKELYTVLLSRELYLPHDDIHAVRSQLHRKSLSIHSTRKLCNGSSKGELSHVLLVALGWSIVHKLLT